MESAKACLLDEQKNIGIYNQFGFENLALLALLVGDFSIGTKVIEIGLKKYPKSSWLQARSAYLNYQIGMIDEAYARFQYAIEIDKEIPVILQFWISTSGKMVRCTMNFALT